MATNETVVVIKMNLSRCFCHTGSIEVRACVLKWLSLNHNAFASAEVCVVRTLFAMA